MELNTENNNISENTFAGEKSKKPKNFSLIYIIILSLFFGSVGGSVSLFYLLKNEKIGSKVLGSNFFKNPVSQVETTENSAIIGVVKKTSPAVVSIVVSEDLNKIPGYGRSPFDFFLNDSTRNWDNEPNIQEVAAGSGFFVSNDGLILTNKHVVSTKTGSYTVITNDGESYEAKVLAQDPAQDLALIKIDIQNAPFLDFNDSEKLEIGQQVIAIGNSLGEYQNTVTSGIISGIGRKITAGGIGSYEDLSGVIQTDAAINPGNSGGPLLDYSGKVIGINTAIDEQGQLVGFAIPSNDAVKALASYQKNGKITKAFLGVRYIIINSSISKEQNLKFDYGALVVKGGSSADFAVQPGSPADKAGIKENDIILEVAAQKITEKSSLADLLKKYNSGDSVVLKVYHAGEVKDLTVILGETK